LMVSVPRRLRNSALTANLDKNSRELITMFDLHATFVDISESSFATSKSTNFSETIIKPNLKGTSLLRPLPSTPRNCKTLPIPPQYCLCKIEKEKKTWITAALSESVGTAIAHAVNERLADWNVTDICAHLVLDKITDLQMIVGGKGLFEATARLLPGR
ncbi:hypothetical protein PFISCL1PPCAC_9288, partial [Pristionchus fissidentatus]